MKQYNSFKEVQKELARIDTKQTQDMLKVWKILLPITIFFATINIILAIIIILKPS